MKDRVLIAGLICMLFPFELIAAPDSGEQEPATATAVLLSMQSKGINSSPDDQHLDGKVRENIYKRYVESFSSPIPDRFTEDSFTTED